MNETPKQITGAIAGWRIQFRFAVDITRPAWLSTRWLGPKSHSTMKTIHHILGILWVVIAGYFCASLSLGTYHIIAAHNYRLINLTVTLFFVLLYLAGTVASFFVLRGSRRGRIIVGVVALFTVTASVMGLFAFFNSAPYSVVGITFDVFAFVSAGFLLLSRRYVSA